MIFFDVCNLLCFNYKDTKNIGDYQTFKRLFLSRTQVIKKLANFKQQFGAKFGITKLGVFGSVARGENTEDSDVDIVVEVEKPTLVLMHELHEALVLLFNCKVDLVRYRKSLRPLMLSNIKKDAVYV